LTADRIKEFFRYLAISVLALGMDMGVLLLTAKVMDYLVAATLGFVVGAVVSYVLATRWAFGHRRFAQRPRVEFAAYVIIGILGLAVNNLTIYVMVEQVNLSLAVAKLVAAMLTFAFNFLVRMQTLFRKATPT
jgi:putative flippase GtrA